MAVIFFFDSTFNLNFIFFLPKRKPFNPQKSKVYLFFAANIDKYFDLIKQAVKNTAYRISTIKLKFWEVT